MSSWAWTLLILVGRHLGSPAAEAPNSAGETRPDLSWKSSDLDSEVRKEVLRGITSGSRERALVLSQTAMDLELATRLQLHAASLGLLLRGIPKFSVPGTLTELDRETRRLLGELAQRLPSRLVRNCRESLDSIQRPSGHPGRVSPAPRDQFVAFLTGTARGPGGTR
ncbi:MAG TPA: hypothetical protein VKU80_05965 [Planctomycetota bacterium]|nr:hypothetical protein [Planctomycetota bacterium]